MHIKFNCLVEVDEISIREKEDGTRYAVVRVTFTAKRRYTRANLICFNESLYSKLTNQVWYEFEGNVVVQSGNTFLVIMKSKEAFKIPY